MVCGACGAWGCDYDCGSSGGDDSKGVTIEILDPKVPEMEKKTTRREDLLAEYNQKATEEAQASLDLALLEKQIQQTQEKYRKAKTRKEELKRLLTD